MAANEQVVCNACKREVVPQLGWHICEGCGLALLGSDESPPTLVEEEVGEALAEAGELTS